MPTGIATRYPARTYTAKDVPWRLRDHVQPRAVLAAVTGRYRSKEDILRRALAIRWKRQRAATRLRKRGWAALADPNRYRAARDCPMTFVMVYGQPRCCRLATACPFCWARQAAQWWDGVDAAFFRDTYAG